MIDTIHLKVHNLSNYDKIYNQFYNPEIEKKKSITRAFVDEATAKTYERVSVPGIVFHDTSVFLPVIHRNTLLLPSSHYSVSYCINVDRDFIEFNVSIPKFEFGLNVMQFINLFDQSSAVVYNSLMAFIEKFINEFFIQKPLMIDVEIFRLDFCYNQLFNSREDSFLYLDHQKKFMSKYSRKESNNHPIYGTSIYYHTKRYTWKIYHKGSEFLKNDCKEILKADNPKNIPIQFFKDEADKMLRYELEYRNQGFNYFCNRDFLNDIDENHINFYHPLAIMARRMRSELHRDDYEKYFNSAKKFCVDSPLSFTSKSNILKDQFIVKFDFVFFNTLFKNFWKKVDEWQIYKKLSLDQVSQKIDDFNDQIKLKNELRRKKLPLKDKSPLLVLALLHSSMDNFKDLQKHLPEQTFYRYVRNLKSIGIGVKDVELEIPQPTTDYLEYRRIFSKFH
ncbi:MAG: phage/plasmid replication protein [Xanthomarina sp.]